MAGAVFALCALTSLACAVLLLRAYRAERVSLLLWTCLCFAGLATNNILLFLDLLLGLDLEAERAARRGQLLLGGLGEAAGGTHAPVDGMRHGPGLLKRLRPRRQARHKREQQARKSGREAPNADSHSGSPVTCHGWRSTASDGRLLPHTQPGKKIH